MKKSDIALILGVVIVIILSIFAFSNKGENMKESVTLSDDFAGVKQISYSEYNTMVEEDKTFILLVSREGCTYCESFAPIIEEVSNEKNIPIYKVDIATFEEDELEEFNSSNSFLKRGDWGTPTTLVLKGTEVIDTLSGLTEKDKLIEFLDENVVVPEVSE